MFSCTSCTTKDNNSFVNQNNLSNTNDNSSNTVDNLKNNNNDNEITTWEDKNFEALIRYYLGNFDKDIYFKDLNNITDLEIIQIQV